MIKLYPEFKELLEVALNWDYGTVHTHEEIAKIMCLEPKSGRYYSAVATANKRLLDTQKMLKVVPKVGYKVCEPAEYTAEAVRQIKLSKKRSNKAVMIATLAPIDKMTLDEQIKHRQISDRAMSYHAMVSGVVVESKLLLAKK